MSKLIFLIDDDEDEKVIFQEALLQAGNSYDFIYLNAVTQALDILESKTPDSIFIDMNMPGTDGLKGIAILRAIDKLQAVPIVMYSNGISEKLCTAAINTGATYCLKKASSIKELSDFLKKHLD